MLSTQEFSFYGSVLLCIVNATESLLIRNDEIYEKVSDYRKDLASIENPLMRMLKAGVLGLRKGFIIWFIVGANVNSKLGGGEIIVGVVIGSIIGFLANLKKINTQPAAPFNTASWGALIGSIFWRIFY